MTLQKLPLFRFRVAGLVFMLLGCCLLTSCSDAAQHSFASKGKIDLSHWDFNTYGTASLAGEWQFVQGRLLNPEQFPLPETSPDYLQLPHIWQGTTTRGKPLNAIGCGTYRLRVQLPPDAHGSFSLLTTGTLSVCKIFVNGKALAASGTPACQKNEERPQGHFSIASFSAAPSIELVIQISNHHNTQGGLGGWIMLGNAQDIQGHMRFLWLSGALVSGALLCMSLYHFALYFLRRSFKANLYFGLFCFFWSVATGFSPTSGYLMNAVGLKLSWGLYVTLATLPYGLTTPLLLLFYQTLSPKKYGKTVTGIYLVLGALYISYILATPPNAYDPALFVYFLLTRGAYAYIFAMFTLDAIRREHGILLLAPGYLGLAYAELDDILFDLNIVTSADFGLFGVLLFILAYSLFVSSRYARAYSKLEQFSRSASGDGRQTLLAGMTGMFDSLKEAVIALNEDREICFCNNAFSRLSGFGCDKLKGRPFSDMLETQKTPVSTALLEMIEGEGPPLGKACAFQDVRLAQGNKSLSANLLITGIELANAPLLLVLVRKQKKTGSGLKRTEDRKRIEHVPANMLRDLNANRQRILKLEKTVTSLDINDRQESQFVLDDLKALDDLLMRLGKCLTTNDPLEERRLLAVTVMELALDCWSAAGHGGKVELAEKSGIWNVYLEKDGYFRTQTLDKYLAIKTLPSRPRWRDIHATAEFVLANCDADIPACQRLVNALAEFKAAS